MVRGEEADEEKGAAGEKIPIRDTAAAVGAEEAQPTSPTLAL